LPPVPEASIGFLPALFQKISESSQDIEVKIMISYILYQYSISSLFVKWIDRRPAAGWRRAWKHVFSPMDQMGLAFFWICI
jgi:hypothetical protein